MLAEIAALGGTMLITAETEMVEEAALQIWMQENRTRFALASNRLSRLGQIVLDRLVDVAPRPLAKDYRLGAHLLPDSRTRSRSRSK